MAQKVVVTLVDDLDSELDADETVSFALDGVSLEIDLSDGHAAEMRDVFQRYVAAARVTGGRKRTGRKALDAPGVAAAAVKAPAAGRGTSFLEAATAKQTKRGGKTRAVMAEREQNQAIREWAEKQGFTVAKRGRIPNEITELFQKHAPGPIPKGEDETPTDRSELTLNLTEGDDTTTGDDLVVPLTVVHDDESDESDPVEQTATVAREVSGDDNGDPSEWGDTPALLNKDQKKVIATWAHGQGMIDSASSSRVTRDMVAQYKAVAARELANA